MEERNYGYIKNHINSLVLKLTNFCNEGCNYCYRENTPIEQEKIMSDEVINKTIERYLNFLCKSNSDKDYIHIIWHGGEPLLAGLDKFKKIMEIENEFNEKAGIKFINEVHTKGLLIDEEWAKFFEDNKFYIEINLSGTDKFINKSLVKDKEKSRFEKTINNIKLLKNYNVNMNISSVISDKVYLEAEETYDFIKRTGISDIDFLPIFCHFDERNSQNKNYESFRMNILDSQEDDNSKSLNIKFLDGLESKNQITMLQEKEVEEYRGSKFWGDNLSIGVEGEIYPCGNFIPIKAYYMGNIMEDSLERKWKSNEFEKFKWEFNFVEPECFKCDEYIASQIGDFYKKSFEIKDSNREKKMIIKIIKSCYNRANSKCQNS